MSKSPSPGSEVDAWCTKCKLDLGHRIIAMNGDKIVRVECLTCRGHHNYRRPKSAEPPKRTRATSSRSSSGARSTRAAKADPLADARKQWETAIAGRTQADFTPYNIKLQLQTGQLLRHKKFGDGLVAELIEGGKASVIFEDGPKTLVHSR
mgnify:CR=1 FL=1